MAPKPGESICDPACGTGGFLFTAHNHIVGHNKNLTRDQPKLREQMTKTFGPGAFQAMEEQGRANMAFFTEAMRMWSPFPGAKVEGEPEKPAQPQPAASSELDSLKKQMAEMQVQLEKLAKR